MLIMINNEIIFCLKMFIMVNNEILSKNVDTKMQRCANESSVNKIDNPIFWHKCDASGAYS